MKSLNQAESLRSLDIKPGTRDVLVALANLGRSPAADIAAHLNKPKSSVYDGLDELVRIGLATEESDNNSRMFSIADPEQITQIKAKQISSIEVAFSEIAKMASEQTKTVGRPRIKSYAGVEGMRQAFRDMQWNSKYQDIYVMWPMAEMIDALGEPFLKMHSSGRYDHNVMLHAISKESDRELRQDLEHEWLEHDPTAKLREVRYAPKDADWSMSFWVYGEQTLFAGSGKERFAFVVRSREFADLMILLWKQMWENSKE